MQSDPQHKYCQWESSPNSKNIGKADTNYIANDDESGSNYEEEEQNDIIKTTPIIEYDVALSISEIGESNKKLWVYYKRSCFKNICFRWVACYQLVKDVHCGQLAWNECNAVKELSQITYI